ncbi:MAG: tetratricopeptide repeat protein [Candidatus Aceula meridiana]|nr:tetratricopeptide repeat protein [Candidatus Aceula meridiana]
MKKILWILVILSFFPKTCLASVRSQVKQGNHFYEKKEYQKSLENYKKALKENENSDIINFNLGSAFYKNEDYAQSLEHFQKALLSDQEPLKQKAHYNLGNAFYQDGIMQEEKDLPSAVQSLEKSLASFKKAIDLEDQDSKAKHNYEFVKKELERLKKEMQQQKQNKAQSQQSSESKNKDQKDQQQQDKQQSSQKNQAQQNKDQDKTQEQQQEQNQQKGQQQSNEQTPKSSQGEEEKKGQSSSSSSEGQKDAQKSKQQEGQGTAQQDQSKMSGQEAKMFLDHYQQTEEPKGFLNLNPQGKTAPVGKDW